MIKKQHEERLTRILRELSNKIAQNGLNRIEEDEEYKRSIIRSPVAIFKNLADFLDFDYQIFLDMFNSVGDSIKFQLLGLIEV